jgi:hypothetical protein
VENPVEEKGEIAAPANIRAFRKKFALRLKQRQPVGAQSVASY